MVVFMKTYCDAPPSFLMDSIVSPQVKTTEGEGVGVRWSFEMGLGRLTNKFNYSHGSGKTKH
jgi:hypothetical protein